MTNRTEVYRCNVCGNITEVLHTGKGTMTCCNQNMECITENTVDAAKEKHVPVVERTNNGIVVQVGSVEHPMEDKHYIEWIEVLVDDKVYREHLKPGQKPIATFKVEGNRISAREYCNLHGLWKGE